MRHHCRAGSGLSRHVLVLLMVAVLGGCTGDHTSRRSIIALIDYSGSFIEDQLDNCITTLTKDVLANFGPYDGLSVYPIDAGAVIRNQRLLELDLRQHTFTRQTDGVTHAADSVKTRVGEYLLGMTDSVAWAVRHARQLRSEYTRETDIIGALIAVQDKLDVTRHSVGFAAGWNNFMGRPQVLTQNVIVICSDMVQEDPQINFAGRVGALRNVDSLVAELAEANRLARLSGATVFVSGRTGESAEQVSAVQRFWVRYFADAGADLRGYDYDAGPQIRAYMAPPK